MLEYPVQSEAVLQAPSTGPKPLEDFVDGVHIAKVDDRTVSGERSSV